MRFYNRLLQLGTRRSDQKRGVVAIGTHLVSAFKVCNLLFIVKIKILPLEKVQITETHFSYADFSISRNYEWNPKAVDVFLPPLSNYSMKRNIKSKISNSESDLVAVVVRWNAISFYCTHTNHLRFTVLGINQFKSPKAKKVQQFPLNCLLF